jgi:hypothetical protein
MYLTAGSSPVKGLTERSRDYVAVAALVRRKHQRGRKLLYIVREAT